MVSPRCYICFSSTYHDPDLSSYYTAIAVSNSIFTVVQYQHLPYLNPLYRSTFSITSPLYKMRKNHRPSRPAKKLPDRSLQQPTQASLMGLPAELRIKILENCLPSGRSVNVGQHSIGIGVAQLTVSSYRGFGHYIGEIIGNMAPDVVTTHLFFQSVKESTRKRRKSFTVVISLSKSIVAYTRTMIIPGMIPSGAVQGFQGIFRSTEQSRLPSESMLTSAATQIMCSFIWYLFVVYSSRKNSLSRIFVSSFTLGMLTVGISTRTVNRGMILEVWASQLALALAWVPL